MIRFGSGGNSQSFYDRGYKTSLDICQFLNSYGLNAYEYECTRGVRLSDAFCQNMRRQAQNYDVALSIHAPYYISLASINETIREKSIEHLLKALRAAQMMGADRVVFHAGGVSGQDRAAAMQIACSVLENACAQADAEGLLDTVWLCPETMGKKNELGTLAEVLQLCQVHPSLMPCVDFAHIHALYGGALLVASDFERVLERIAKSLGEDAIQNLHVHFSPIEYTKAGEKCHRTLSCGGFGPDFFPFAQVIYEHKLTPRIICESAGTQTEDAVEFREIYNKIAGEQL